MKGSHILLSDLPDDFRDFADGWLRFVTPGWPPKWPTGWSDSAEVDRVCFVPLDVPAGASLVLAWLATKAWPMLDPGYVSENATFRYGKGGVACWSLEAGPLSTHRRAFADPPDGPLLRPEAIAAAVREVLA